MTTSICITVFNEADNLKVLLESLLVQSKKANEIVVVDGGSTDSTPKLLKDYAKKYKVIKVFFKKCTRAEGRNIGIKLTKNEIVAVTDAGCVARTDWLKKIVDPFNNKSVDVVAGYYTMGSKNSVQKAMSIFLGVTPRKFTNTFLPSTRSMAFRKSAWQKVGGFPESGQNSAEDTDFNYKALKIGLKYARAKTALVEWGMPVTILDFAKKLFVYAKWDARYGIWWHPSHGLMSHNIKVLTIWLRYLTLVLLFWLSFKFDYLFPTLIILFFLYLAWAYRKVFSEFGDSKTAIWGPILQITSDISVMAGFVSGIMG